MDVKDFAELTYDQQIVRLERLGREALKQFGVEPHRLTPLVHAENTTFKVEGDLGQFCLRICRPGYQSIANVESEIVYLAALSKHGFCVPNPFQERLVLAGSPDVPEARKCVLFHWLDGEFPDGDFSEDQIRLLGQTMAELHQFAEHWVPPPGFERQNLNDSLFQEMPFRASSVAMSHEDRATLIDGAEECRDLIRSLPSDTSMMGLIHSDLHRNNVLYRDGQIQIIDFDDIGFGYWAMDIAAATTTLLGTDEGLAKIQALLRAYEDIRPLPPETRELLPNFYRMRLVRFCQWLLERTDNPQIMSWAPSSIEKCGHTMRRLQSLSFV
jgi:Ser/Thr protein kinase RdoA (MazF antagonist)